MLPACGHSVCHMLQSPCLPIVVACAPSQTVNPDEPFVSVTLLLLWENTETKSNLRKQEWDLRGSWFPRGKSSWWQRSLQQAAGMALGAGSWEITASTTNTKQRDRTGEKPSPSSPHHLGTSVPAPKPTGDILHSNHYAFSSETLPQQ